MAFMDYVKLYREKGTEAWGKLPTRQRWIYGGIGAMILVGFVLLIASFGSGEGGMVPLKAVVKDPNVAARHLAKFQIQAVFDDDQNTLLVPKEKERQAVLILGSASMLPNAKQAYAFLSETDLTQTDARMHEALRTTLEEVLSETLAAMSSIDQAEVRISPPYRTHHFHPESNETKAKAHVTVSLRDQEYLEDSQVAGIVQMVAFSYPNLPPENVTITDTNLRPYRYSPEWVNVTDYVRLKSREEALISTKIEANWAQFDARAAATVFVETGSREKGEVEVPVLEEGRTVYEEGRTHMKTGTEEMGTAGAVGEVGPAARDDPGRSRVFTEERDEESMAKTEYGKRHDIYKNDNFIPVFEKSNVAVTLNEKHKAALEPKMNELKQHVSSITSIPVPNISIMFAPMPEPMGGDGSALTGIWAAIMKPENLVKIVLLVLAVGAFVALMLMLKKSAPKPLTLVDENLGEEEAEPMPEVPFLPPVNQLEGNVVREKVVELVRKNPKAAANLVKRWILFGK